MIDLQFWSQDTCCLLEPNLDQENEKSICLYISSLLGETSLQVSFGLKSESAKGFVGLTLILLHQNNWLPRRRPAAARPVPQGALWHRLRLQELSVT